MLNTFGSIELHYFRNREGALLQYVTRTKCNNKICVTNCLKSAKKSITVCKFSKIFRGSLPPDPSKIIFVSLFASNLTLPEKIPLSTLKKCQNLVLKSSEYATFTWTHFLKRAYLRSFSGLTSLHSVNIQSNSKLHPPTPKFSGSAPTAHLRG